MDQQGNPTTTRQQFWDLLFGTNGEKILSISPWLTEWNNISEIRRRRETIRKEFNDANWVYSSDRTGKALKIWIPDVIYCAAMDDTEAAQLEALSLEFSWLSVAQLAGSPSPMHSGELSRFKNLRFLALGDAEDFGDYTFLSAMPLLEELWLTSLQTRISPDFSAKLVSCGNLKRLVFSDTPDAPLAASLKQLPKLEEIILVEPSSGDLEKEAATLRKILGNVTVKTLAASDLATLTPEEFLRHREQVRQNILSR